MSTTEPAANDVRCPRCGARLPRHYPPCAETRLSTVFVAAWCALGLPIVLLASAEHKTPVYLLALAVAWAVTFVGLRHW